MDSHGGMILTEENLIKLGEKLVPVPLCPPQIQHGLIHYSVHNSQVLVHLESDAFSPSPIS
jgi:hypothetical protein